MSALSEQISHSLEVLRISAKCIQADEEGDWCELAPSEVKDIASTLRGTSSRLEDLEASIQRFLASTDTWDTARFDSDPGIVRRAAADLGDALANLRSIASQS